MSESFHLYSRSVGIIALVFHTTVTTLGVAMLAFPFFHKPFPFAQFLALLILDAMFVIGHLSYRTYTRTSYQQTDGRVLIVAHGALSLGTLIGAFVLWYFMRDGGLYPFARALLAAVWVLSLITGIMYWRRKNRISYTQE